MNNYTDFVGTGIMDRQGLEVHNGDVLQFHGVAGGEYVVEYSHVFDMWTAVRWSGQIRACLAAISADVTIKGHVSDLTPLKFWQRRLALVSGRALFFGEDAAILERDLIEQLDKSLKLGIKF